MLQSRIIRVMLIGLTLIILATVAALYLPPGVDWRDTYRPAALALLSGQSPYRVDIFFAAPWTVLPLLPLAVLPEQVGRAILFVVGIVALAYVAYRLGAKPIALAAFLASPPVLHGLLNSNIEWMPLLGFVMPPQWGLFFVAIKPQIGWAVALFWAVEAWRVGRWRELVRVFWPITLALLASFVVFGPWPVRFRDTLVLTRAYNASLWPSSIPVGLALLVASIRKREIRYAMGASPCLSPYVLFHAWVGALVSIVSLTTETVAAVAGLWILVILRAPAGGL